MDDTNGDPADDNIDNVLAHVDYGRVVAILQEHYPHIDASEVVRLVREHLRLSATTLPLPDTADDTGAA